MNIELERLKEIMNHKRQDYDIIGQDYINDFINEVIESIKELKDEHR